MLLLCNKIHKDVTRKKDVYCYGENPQSDVRYFNHRMDGGVSLFDVDIRNRKTGATVELRDLRLPMPGRHNVSNAVARFKGSLKARPKKLTFENSRFARVCSDGRADGQYDPGKSAGSWGRSGS